MDNIFAKKGEMVIVTETSILNGWDYDREVAQKHLVVGKQYTIEKTEVHSWHTKVLLQEFPGVKFNSVSFENVTSD